MWHFNAQMCCLNVKRWHKIYWTIMKPPLCIRRLSLASFDLQQMAERVYIIKKKKDEHLSPIRLHTHTDMPGDSDLHGHRRWDIIYDIYNILDPLAGIMK